MMLLHLAMTQQHCACAFVVKCCQKAQILIWLGSSRQGGGFSFCAHSLVRPHVARRGVHDMLGPGGGVHSTRGGSRSDIQGNPLWRQTGREPPPCRTILFRYQLAWEACWLFFSKKLVRQYCNKYNVFLIYNVCTKLS